MSQNSTPSRRTVTLAAGWTAPAIVASVSAPAFAASQRCRPIAECKKQGEGQNRKTYVVRTNCGASDAGIQRVTVDAQSTQPLGDGRFETVPFGDSRNFREVVVTFSDGTSETYSVGFPPCKD